MGAYNKSELLTIELPEDVPEHMPYVFDDHSLAFSLGIRGKTLWWLLLGNNLKAQKSGKGMYNEYKIPKRGKSGGHRTIHEPREALKNVQKSILMTFFGELDAPKYIGAYVPGRNLQYTARQHVGKAVKVAMDIKNFFPSTRRSWIRNWLRTFNYNEWTVKALSGLMVIPTEHRGKVLSVLPQGAPTSGLIANYVAQRKIDKPILNHLSGLPFDSTYTRYSDNLEISFVEDLPFDYVDSLVRDLKGIIHNSGYRVNHKKTDVQRQKSPDRSMRVLGMTVNEKVNVPQEEYRRLRAIVHNCKEKGFDTQFERAGQPTPGALYTHIHGKLVYWNQINPARVAPLLEEFKEAAKVQGVT